MSFFEIFPFDHAVQIKYNANDQEISRTTVTSGDLKVGYERSNDNWDGSKAPHYKCELWFRVPPDAYKYYYFGQFWWWNGERNQELPVDYIEHYYYVDFRSGVATDGYRVSTGTYSSMNYVPEGISGYGIVDPYRDITLGRFNHFKLDEILVNRIQTDGGADYIMIFLEGGYIEYTQNPEGYFYQRLHLSTFNIDNLIFGISATPITFNIAPVYPVNVYASNERDLTVDWDLSHDPNRDPTYVYQDSNVVTITDKDGNSIEKGVTGSTDSQVVFDVEDLEDLSIGECTVHVVITSNYGTTGEATFNFELVGQSDAPEITNVSQNSYPTVTWTSTMQISWEMQISNSQGIVYKSGMVIGNDTEYTIPIFLEDGGYSIELRYINSYGLLTEWGSYFVDLHPTKPDAPEGVIVSARTDFGVSVSCSDMETTGKLFVVRRKDENSTPVILGEYNGTFVDYLIGLNDYHQYTIRNYVEGYADGEWIDGVVLAEGEVIRDSADYSKFIHIWKSEDNVSNYEISEDKSDVLMQCVGRIFPIAEFGEWITSRRRFGGYVSDADFKKLRDIKLKSNHVLLQAKEEYMPCYMEFSDNGQYIDGGKFVSFNMTRIDGEK